MYVYCIPLCKPYQSGDSDNQFKAPLFQAKLQWALGVRSTVRLETSATIYTLVSRKSMPKLISINTVTYSNNNTLLHLTTELAIQGN